MKRQVMLGTIFGILLSIGAAARAEEGAMDKVRDDAHSAADHVDAAAHKAKRKVVHHARRAKTDVKNSVDDNPVRKAGRRANDAGNDALDKVDDTVHGH